jgi:hypothetical protein
MDSVSAASGSTGMQNAHDMTVRLEDDVLEMCSKVEAAWQSNGQHPSLGGGPAHDKLPAWHL